MPRVTYITATLAPTTRDRVTARSKAGKVTKAGVKAALSTDGEVVEFISTDAHHNPGSWFTGPEAVNVYGPVGVELHDGNTLMIVEFYPSKPAVVR